MSKEKVESQESKVFELYLKEIYDHYRPEDLSYFEHNLEVSACTSHNIHCKCYFVDMATIVESTRNVKHHIIHH